MRHSWLLGMFAAQVEDVNHAAAILDKAMDGETPEQAFRRLHANTLRRSRIEVRHWATFLHTFDHSDNTRKTVVSFLLCGYNNEEIRTIVKDQTWSALLPLIKEVESIYAPASRAELR